MNEKLIVNGLSFKPFLRIDEIRKQVARVAEEIRRDYEGKNPIFLCVLNGAFIFAADLYRELGMNETHSLCEVFELRGRLFDRQGEAAYRAKCGY